ncbi:MAG: PHB depolymerase family esterase [Vulcanimicrobiota bacterium]
MPSGRWLLAWLLLASGLAAARPGLHEKTFDQAGVTRRYLLYTPKQTAALEGARPLVFVIHGGSGTARQMVRMTGHRFNQLADQHGFYVVYPEAGGEKLWNFGEGEISASIENPNDDLAYFKTVLEQVQSVAPIDSRRIFATGISRGGQACYFLVGKLPGVFRAVAPVTMPLPGYLEDDCTDGPPVGLAVFNGTGDPLVPYQGGMIRILGRDRDAVLSTEKTLAIFRRRNGCSQSPDSVRAIDAPGDNTSVTRTSWPSSKGAPVVLYEIKNGGHTWPSGPQYLPVSMVGEVSRDLNAADEIWIFFSSFR